MSTTAYIDQLKQLRTHQTHIIGDIQEYKFKLYFLGLFRTLPPLPNASNDRQVVVVKIRGSQPNKTEFLTKPTQTINLSIQDVGQVVFVYLSVKPQKIKIESPPRGYQLADEQEVVAELELLMQVTDAKEFWDGAKDPIAVLESEVINETRNYFWSIDSSKLSQMNTIAKELETQICWISLPGINIQRVYPQITFTRMKSSS